MYQIFVDRFYNGDPTNDVQDGEYEYLKVKTKHKDWDQLPETFDVANFYGGDLQGIIDKLDYLEDMGVEVLYLNPIFSSPSNHKYDIEDYRTIDKHFGTNEKFVELVNELHKRGMKIILDGVFNHCSDRNPWMQILEYFLYDEKGRYESWWDNETLPKLNYEGSEELIDEVMDIAKFWLKEPYCIDGWRLDVAADLGHSEEFNHRFWKRFRKEVKSVNPQALIIAEHYGDPSPWLQGDEWDSVMNYDGFMEPVSTFLTGMEKHSDCFDEEAVGNGLAFMETIEKARKTMSEESFLSAMNELDNHDHSRFLTRTNRVAGRLAALGSEAAEDGTNICFLRQAQLLQFTLPGAPTIYYGDEAGVKGFTDPDSRRTYPWGKEDKECLEYCRGIAQIHKCSAALRSGELIWITAQKDLVIFARKSKDETMISAVYTGDEEKDVIISLEDTGIGPDDEIHGILYSDCWNFGFTGSGIDQMDGYISLRVKPHGAYLLQSKRCIQ